MGTTKKVDNRDKLKRFSSFVLVAILAVTLVFPLNIPAAYAAPTPAEVKAEADSANATLAAAEEELLKVTDDYFAAAMAHDEAVLAMEEAQGRIDAAEEIIRDLQVKLGSRANQMYRQGPYSFLDVIFGASSFEEFTTSWELVSKINEESLALIEANKDARTEAEAARTEFSLQEKAAAEQLAEAEAIKVRAEGLVAEQQALVASLDAEVVALLDAEQAARVEVYDQQSSGGGSYGPPVPSDGYPDVVAAAQSRLGCPYVYGGTGPDVFDCSGLTSWVYRNAGRGEIGRGPSDQYARATARWPYAEGGAAPGDVLWWPSTPHVAIYVGGGQFIHAPLPGQTVCYSSWDINTTIVLRF